MGSSSSSCEVRVQNPSKPSAGGTISVHSLQSCAFTEDKKGNYAAHMCRNATLAQPCIWNAENNGWELVQGKYTMYWFDGSEVPLNGAQRIDESILTSQDELADHMYNEVSDESDSDV